MSTTTLLPFLYQTRTLQQFSRTRVTTPAFQAFFHASSRSNLPHDHHPAGAQRRPRKVYDAIPFELPPSHQAEGLKRGHRSTITPTERDAFDRIFQEIAERGGAPADEVPQDNRIPGAAGGFLPNLFTEKTDEFQLPEHGEPTAEEGEKKNKGKKKENTPSLVNVIVQGAAESQKQNRRKMQEMMKLKSLSPMGQIADADDPDKALLRFPPSLRKAARRALGVVDDDGRNWARDADDQPGGAASTEEAAPGQSDASPSELEMLDDIADNPLSGQVSIEMMRRTERMRVVGRMHEAKTDFELWDVLEEEVFPMVERLGIKDAALSTETTSKKKVAKARKKQAKKTKAAAAAADDETAAVPTASAGNDKGLPMKIYGPLYPLYLFNALRLFDRSFERSSPMALNLLPRIKELGLMSFILGVSTPFYNTLAGILWYRYGDARAVVDLLEEMRHVGLYGEGGTAAVLNHIKWEIKECEDGAKGPFAKEIVDMPEYKFVLKRRLRHWTQTIDRDLAGRRADYGLEGDREVKSRGLGV